MIDSVIERTYKDEIAKYKRALMVLTGLMVKNLKCECCPTSCKGNKRATCEGSLEAYALKEAGKQ